MPFSTKFPSTEDLNRVADEDQCYKLGNCDVFDHDGKTDRGAFRLKEFFANDKKKSQILAIALNIAPLITDAGTDFLFGEPVRIEADDSVEEKDDGEGVKDGKESNPQKKIDAFKERNSFLTKLEESSTLLQRIGHTHFKLYANEQREAFVEEVPYNYWYPNWDGAPLGQDTKNPRIAVRLAKTDEKGVETKYIYIEDYILENKKAFIEYSLWEDSAGQLGNQVGLETLGLMPTGTVEMVGGEKLLTARQDTLLDELPIVSIHLRKTVKERYGESIFKRILPLLEELNDRITQVSLQFLKHFDPLLQLPENAIVRDPKTGRVQRVNLEVILAKQGDAEAKYVTNSNPMIEEAFTHIDKIIRLCAKLTQTPDSFLTEDEKGGVEKAEALKTRLMLFLKRIKLYQRKYDEAIKAIIRIALKIEGVKDAPLVITFDAGLPKDWEYDGNVWGNALGNGLASQETAVSMFQGIEGEELDAEIERIKEDEKAAPQFDLSGGQDQIPPDVFPPKK